MEAVILLPIHKSLQSYSLRLSRRPCHDRTRVYYSNKVRIEPDNKAGAQQKCKDNGLTEESKSAVITQLFERNNCICDDNVLFKEDCSMLDDISSPSFLFQSKKADPSENPLSFLADRQDLKNIVSCLCKDLRHPIALIDYNALMKSDSPEKLESMVEMYPMRRSCSVFRKCAGEDYCAQCDRFHARFMDTQKVSIEKRIQDSLDHMPAFFYPEYRDRPPKVLESFDRPVIEYHCPMLGYRELLFPLMYRGRVYGVFFAGQIMVYAEADEIINKTISESFFKKNSPDELFKEFIDGFNAPKKTGELSGRSLKTRITGSDRNARPYDDLLGFRPSEKKELEYYSKNFNTLNDYHQFIDTVCHAIAEIEKKLPGAYEERRKKIISETLGQMAERYFENYRDVHKQEFKNRHEASAGELKSSWDALKRFSWEIRKEFKLVERILVFGDRQGIRLETTGKKEIAFSISDIGNDWEGSFDFSINPINGISDSANSVKKPEILEGLSEGLQTENSILIQCHDIAMLIQVEDLEQHKGLYVPLSDAVEKELVRINNIIALCTANLTKEKYLLTLRMYRHENAHISTRLMGNINRYFENGGGRFLNADGTKRQMVCNDMKNTVQLISNIADNISFVTGTGIAAEDPKKNEAPFDVVDMLYKWQIMFRDELENRNLDIIVYRGGHDSSTIGYRMAKYIFILASEITRQQRKYETAPSVIPMNARLFELLVYNLVDNAVKYAYRGTNIYLIWGRYENEYELSVTSYGPRMPEGDDMYGLYARGNDARIIQGDGLGLYVVRKIAEKLGLDVCHASERIAQYNAPLIPWYNKTDFSKRKSYLKIDESTLTQQNDASQIALAVNNHPQTRITESDLTQDYLIKRIRMETWRTTFRIRIQIDS